MNKEDLIRVSSYTGSGCLKNPHQLRDLLKVYKETFNASLATSCVNCINDGILRIRLELRKINLNHKKQRTMSEKKFELKSNVIIDLTYSGGGYVTPENLTDEKAVEILKLNPKYLKWFSKFPENYEALGTAEVEETKKEVSLLEIDKLVSKHSKAELAEMLDLVDSPLNKSELARKILEK